MSEWRELLRAKGSIYALNESTKQWIDRGSSGSIWLLVKGHEVGIKWSKASRGESWWRLFDGALKPKGERAWVLKALDVATNTEEIIAIRFSDVPSSLNFSAQCRLLFPPQHPPTRSPPNVSASASAWECAVCTYSNDANKASCTICGLSAAASAKALRGRALGGKVLSGKEGGNDSGTESEWSCPSCTFMNAPLALVCSVCRNNKPLNPYSNRTDLKPPLPPRPSSNDSHIPSLWICSICTLQNRYDALQCAACGQRRRCAPNTKSPRTRPVPRPPPIAPPQNMAPNPIPKFIANPKGSMNGTTPMPMIRNMVSVPSATSVEQFEAAASDIANFNDSPKSIFATLRSVSRKLLKDDIRYRTLDTTNPKVVERLVGFEGVIDFLMLLGFQSDEMGLKLICEQKPMQMTVKNAVDVLNEYEQRVANRHISNGSAQRTTTKRAQRAPKGHNVTAGGPGAGGAVDGIDGINALNGIGGGRGNGEEEKEEDTLTLEQIIIWATHEATRDSETMETLIITHRTMTDSLTLLKQLRRRFFVQIPREISSDPVAVTKFRKHVQKSIQLKVIKALRDWMKGYWDEDFSSKFSENGDEMQQEIVCWVEEIDRLSSTDSQCKWLKPLADTVLKEFERFKMKGGDARNGRSMSSSDAVSKRVHLPKVGDDESVLAVLLPMAKDESIEVPPRMNIGGVSVEDIANQITLMDYRIFRRIEPRECIGQCWKKKENKKWAPHIVAMIEQFNKLTLFVQIQVLRPQSLRERSRALRRMIAMGERFKTLRNFNSLCAIYSALNSAPIFRLKLAWKRVPSKYYSMFTNFRTIFSRDLNHRNLRQLFRTAPAPAIPHLGLFLQDLVFIDDGNSNKIENHNLQKGAMVNFSKCVRITERVKQIRLYQQHSYTDTANLADRSLEENVVIQKMLMMEFERMQHITEDQVWTMSDEIKKLDQRDHKKINF